MQEGKVAPEYLITHHVAQTLLSRSCIIHTHTHTHTKLCITIYARFNTYTDIYISEHTCQVPLAHALRKQTSFFPFQPTSVEKCPDDVDYIYMQEFSRPHEDRSRVFIDLDIELLSIIQIYTYTCIRRMWYTQIFENRPRARSVIHNSPYIRR